MKLYDKMNDWTDKGINKEALRIAVLGGSNSFMRDGYTKHLKDRLEQELGYDVVMKYFALGGVVNLYGAIQNVRYDIASLHDVILFEYCVNDRNALHDGYYSLDFLGASLEGFVRRAKKTNPSCVIIFLIFGINFDWYYDSCCKVSALYTAIAQRYGIPCINITEIMLKQRGIDALRRLYEKDPFHYSRPEGVEKVAEIIANQITFRKMLAMRRQSMPYRVYAGNFENLRFFNEFGSSGCYGSVNVCSYTNSYCFEQSVLTLRTGSSFKTLFRGKLLGLVLLSDCSSGFVKIRLGSKTITASTYSTFVTKFNKPNVNMLILPPQEMMGSESFDELELTALDKMPQIYHLDWHKTEPTAKKEDWKISVVGLAIIGEIKL